MNYELKTNEYGNVNGIPEGWFEVNVSTQKLKSFKIPYYKAFVGWNKRSKRYINPILVNIIPVQYKSVLTKKLNAEKIKNSPETKINKWRERLVFLTGCTMEQAKRISNLIIENKKKELSELRRGTVTTFSIVRCLELAKELKHNPLAYIKSKTQAIKLIEDYNHVN